MKDEIGKRLKQLFVVLVLLYGTPFVLADTRVEAEGKSVAANLAKARELALADALREAVRKGIGTDVASISKVSNFQLDYDQIFTQAFGLVRDYSILSQGYGDDGIYRVKISATVTDAKNVGNDQQLLSMLVRRKGSPRIAIQAECNISGLSRQPDVKGVIREIALAHQLQIVDSATRAEADANRTRRDELLGDGNSASYRKAGIATNYDFLIRAKISGSYNGLETYGGANTQKYSLGVNLSAVWADSGEVVAEVTMPSLSVSSSMGSSDAGARDAVTRILKGHTANSRKTNAVTIFRRSMVKWITELDLGKKIELELKNVSRTDLDRLITALRETEGVGQVYEREFDSRLTSRLEVESRLNARRLGEEAVKALPSHSVDRITTGYVQVVPGSGGRNSVSGEQSSINREKGSTFQPSGMPPWAWALIGIAGLIVVLLFAAIVVGAFALGKKNGK